MKDSELEQRMNAYFEGAEPPALDLSHVKSEMRRSRRARKKRISAALAAACLILVVAFSALFAFPFARGGSGDAVPQVVRYSIADATPVSVTYAEACEKTPLAERLETLEDVYSNTAYTLYLSDGKEVLLKADVDYFVKGERMRAEISFDLSGGTYEAEEYDVFKVDGYEKLDRPNVSYVYEQSMEAGEYVFRAVAIRSGVKIYASGGSPSSNGLSILLHVIGVR